MQKCKRSGKYVITVLLLILLMTGLLCLGIVIRENNKDSVTEDASAVGTVVSEETIGEEVVHDVAMPTKEEVLAAREWALEGVSKEDIAYMGSCIKKANLALEFDDFYGKFQLLEEPENLAWNYIVGKGEVQVGWAIESELAYEKVETDLSEEEYMQEYGTKVVATIEYSADDFIKLMNQFQEMVYNEALKEDFARLSEKMRLAQETHEKSYLVEVYHILHDLDYFLFRYGPEDVEKYTDDDSTVCKYYGMLHVYGL